MASNLKTFSRSIRLRAEQFQTGEFLSQHLAEAAVRIRTELIQSGEAPPSWRTNVDGVWDAPEAGVKPDGFILYRFNILGIAAAYALEGCQKRSPVRSGKYRKSWAIVVDGRVFEGDLSEIPYDATVHIINPMPYARKIDLGSMKKMSVPPGIVEAVRQLTRRKFPTLDVWRVFLPIPAGNFPDTPYVLKTNGNRIVAAKNSRSSVFRSGGTHLKRRNLAGSAMTYPALEITQRLHKSVS